MVVDFWVVNDLQSVCGSGSVVFVRVVRVLVDERGLYEGSYR